MRMAFSPPMGPQCKPTDHGYSKTDTTLISLPNGSINEAPKILTALMMFVSCLFVMGYCRPLTPALHSFYASLGQEQ